MSKHHHGSFWSLDTQVYDICLAKVTRICLGLGLYSSEWLALYALKEDTGGGTESLFLGPAP